VLLENKAGNYGPAVNTYDLLKFIAIVTMVVDHTGHFFYPQYAYLRVIGRIAFPAFLFLVGYSRKWKSDDTLFFYAFLVTLVWSFTSGPIFPLNILFTIIVTRWAMGYLEKKGWLEKPYHCLLVATAWLLVLTYFIEYGTASFFFSLGGYYLRTKGRTRLTLIVLLLGIVIHTAEQCLLFKFTAWQSMFFTAEMALLFWAFYRFKVVAVIQAAGPVNSITRFIARNALYIYAIHLILMRLLSYTLQPELYTHWRLI
jgi:hypothetical protein